MARCKTTPIRAGEIDVDDGNYLRRTLELTWHELPLLMQGALLLAAALAPPAILVLLQLPLPAGLAALLCAAPAWTAYCYLAGRLAVGRSTDLRAMLVAFAAYYGRGIVLAAPVLVLACLFWGTPDLRSPASDTAAILLASARTVQMLALAFAICTTMQALALLALFDLSLRDAAGNALLILLARPWAALGLAGLAYLLLGAALPLGPGAWLLALVLYALFQVNATLMVSKQLLDAQQARRALQPREKLQ